MRNLSWWAKGLIVAAFLLLPIILLLVKHVALPARLSSALQPIEKIESDRYSVTSETPGYNLTFADPAYFDYLTAKMEIFANQAVVDPRVYHGFPDLKLQYTVSRIEFVLVPTLDQFVIEIGGKNDFAGRGDYEIKNGVLVIRVLLNPDEAKDGLLPGQFGLEDTFLRTAAQSMYYTHGLSDRSTNMTAFAKIRDDIQQYLYSGVFPWPIRIERTVSE
jgi:hypothetical protein